MDSQDNGSDSSSANIGCCGEVRTANQTNLLLSSASSSSLADSPASSASSSLQAAVAAATGSFVLSDTLKLIPYNGPDSNSEVDDEDDDDDDDDDEGEVVAENEVDENSPEASESKSRASQRRRARATTSFKADAAKRRKLAKEATVAVQQLPSHLVSDAASANGLQSRLHEPASQLMSGQGDGNDQHPMGALNEHQQGHRAHHQPQPALQHNLSLGQQQMQRPYSQDERLAHHDSHDYQHDCNPFDLNHMDALSEQPLDDTEESGDQLRQLSPQPPPAQQSSANASSLGPLPPFCTL